MSALTSEFAASVNRRRSIALAIAGSAFLGALYIFAHDQQAIGTINGWWEDELYSLWASEPAQHFADALSQRILPDSNPPLYYAVLYWMRHLIADERSATTFINLGALTVAVLSVLYISKKSDTLPLGLFGCATFLLSGPVLRYSAEGRSYLCAIALTFVASWLCASALLVPRRPPAWSGFALLGALSAMIHVYSALMCCCLAAGLFVAAWFWRRSDLWIPSLALGIPAGALTFAWLAYAHATGSVENLAWIQFSPAKVIIAAGEVMLLAFPVGVDIAALDFALHTAGAPLPDVILAAFPGILAFGLIVLILCYGLSSKRLGAASAAFGVCFLLFFALPVAASFKQPIIIGRYWMIGTPGAIVVLLFLIREWIDDISERGKGWPFSLCAAAAAAAVVGMTTFNGFAAARAFIIAKPIWSGAAVVARLGENCPLPSVRILIHSPPFLDAAKYFYTTVSKMPEGAFIPIFLGGGNSDRHSSHHPSCPILGWAEHVIPDVVHVDVQKATDQELLSLLKIDIASGEAQILRHKKGYVVLRRTP